MSIISRLLSLDYFIFLFAGFMDSSCPKLNHVDIALHVSLSLQLNTANVVPSLFICLVKIFISI